MNNSRVISWKTLWLGNLRNKYVHKCLRNKLQYIGWEQLKFTIYWLFINI